ncbi:zinc finger protein 135-like [Dunckerocampus dactyliophorus]|uniref:zinc finger protein 135-like n=1 Tax=Dunckerocampus dactyliophorus TaxID=161453 RepID=UPI00240570C7|nr:zinc finger protein 135-like [Dunckerocampus dactyliophorus]
MLKELVKERLMAAADDILELFESTISWYQEELCRTREERERHRQELEALCKTQIVLRIGDVHKLSGHQEECPPQPPQPHMEADEEELWTTQERERLLGLEETDLTKLPLTSVLVKTEDHEDKPLESSQLHHRPKEDNRGAEPSGCSSPQHMTTKSDGDHCGGSQTHNLIAPLSDDDDTISHSPEAEDGDGNQECLSGDTDCDDDMRTQPDNKHSECSRKMTCEKCFTCSVCGKSLPNRGALIRHMRRHTGEKPFRCSVCGRCFSEKSNMVCHMRIHTGEKPFGCSVCGKRFTLNSTFVKHTRTHTGEKPFSCSLCGKTFSRRDVLTLHTRTHTRGEPCNCSVCCTTLAWKESATAHGHTRQSSI